MDIPADERLLGDVTAELAWDPSVRGETITVSVYLGAVTLRGTARSVRERREADRAAARVRGVTGVANRIEVRAPDSAPRDDTELRGDVPNALMLDCLVPMTVEARVRSGVVSLTGTAGWQYERAEAELAASGVPGVLGVTNDITLTQPSTGGNDKAAGITSAFLRSVVLRGATLSVAATTEGTVLLTGTVRSLAEREAAIAAAWCAPGVTAVEDQIAVVP